MILRAIVILALLASHGAPADAADPTTALLDALDQCDTSAIATTGPRLDVLVALADGRSALELASVLRAPRACIGHVSTYGEGESELVFVGGRGSPDATGALLWVDRGWWRIAALPLGYRPGTSDVRRHGGARELFSGFDSGGSAGVVGLVGVRIEGPSAAVVLRMLPGGEIRGARILDPDHLYVEGRLTADWQVTWSSHAAWPFGAQWVFERQNGAFVQVAHRQSRDPHFVWTKFIGALLEGDRPAMRRVATEQAVSDGIALGITDRRITPLRLTATADLLRREHMSWDALPAAIRTAPPAGPVSGTFSQFDSRGRTLLEIVATFDRIGDGWVITGLRPVPPLDPWGPQVVP